jgi:hypothetical protein
VGVAVLGAMLAIPGLRLLEGLLVGVSAWDPLTLAGAAAVVLGTAGVSTACAAAAILRIEPGSLLRSS